MKANVAGIIGALASVALTAALAVGQSQATPPSSQSQAAQQPAQMPASPEANPADVSSQDAILKALYDVISGPAGQKRDWNRMRSLFLPGAKMIPTGPRPGGGFGVRMLNVDDYVSRADSLFEKEGFFENEVARRVDEWGHIAQVFSTYESRHGKGEKPFARGINAILLHNDGKRWWIAAIMWEAERPDQPLSERMLKSPEKKQP